MKDDYLKQDTHRKPRKCADKAHADKARRDAEAADKYAAALKTAGNDEQKKKSAEAAYHKSLHDSKVRHAHDVQVCENSPG